MPDGETIKNVISLEEKEQGLGLMWNGKETDLLGSDSHPQTYGFQWLIYRQLILSVYMHQTKPTGMQRDSSSKRQTGGHSVTASAQPGNHNRKNVFPNKRKRKGKQKGSAPHNMFPFQRKAGLVQQETT